MNEDLKKVKKLYNDLIFLKPFNIILLNESLYNYMKELQTLKKKYNLKNNNIEFKGNNEEFKNRLLLEYKFLYKYIKQEIENIIIYYEETPAIKLIIKNKQINKKIDKFFYNNEEKLIFNENEEKLIKHKIFNKIIKTIKEETTQEIYNITTYLIYESDYYFNIELIQDEEPVIRLLMENNPDLLIYNIEKFNKTDKIYYRYLDLNKLNELNNESLIKFLIKHIFINSYILNLFLDITDYENI